MLRESEGHGEQLDPTEEVGRSKDPVQSGFYDEVLQRYSDQAILNADPKCLTATQLERRAILFASRRNAVRTGCQAVSTREPARRRPRKAGRHDTARMASDLPEHAQVDRTMTDATIRVYSVLWSLADEGRDDPPVREIASRALCDIRTAQFAIAALKLSGHLTVIYRPRQPRMSQTNVYQLIHRVGASTTSSTMGEEPHGVKSNCTLLRNKESVVTTSTHIEGCS